MPVCVLGPMAIIFVAFLAPAGPILKLDISQISKINRLRLLGTIVVAGFQNSNSDRKRWDEEAGISNDL